MKEYYPFRGPLRPFSEAFPQIKEMRIDVEERSIGSGKPLETWILTADTISEDVKCHDSACNKKGGFDVMGVVREMIRQKETFREKKFIRCRGHEYAGKTCSRFVNIKVTLAYNEERQTC